MGVLDVANKIFENAWDWSIFPDDIAKMIQEYAEEYHKQECVGCKQKKASYKLFGDD